MLSAFFEKVAAAVFSKRFNRFLGMYVAIIVGGFIVFMVIGTAILIMKSMSPTVGVALIVLFTAGAVAWVITAEEK
jgi:hypothetical protein